MLFYVNFKSFINFQEKVVELLGEMNFAVERWNRLEKEKTEHVQNILDKKLKPKGGIIK